VNGVVSDNGGETGLLELAFEVAPIERIGDSDIPV
jgi:hypothetical protein